MRSTAAFFAIVFVLGAYALLAAPIVRSSGAADCISGQVKGLTGNDHVVVKAVGPQTYRTTTRSEGRWSISGMESGVYTIMPIHARYSFDPEEILLEVGEVPLGDLVIHATAVHD